MFSQHGTDAGAVWSGATCCHGNVITLIMPEPMKQTFRVFSKLINKRSIFLFISRFIAKTPLKAKAFGLSFRTLRKASLKESVLIKKAAPIANLFS